MCVLCKVQTVHDHVFKGLKNNPRIRGQPQKQLRQPEKS